MREVDKGAALLDKRLPGWRKVTDPETLALSDPCDCVLGQLFGSYDRGLDVLKIDDPVASGFYRKTQQRWGQLTSAWREKL